VRAPSCMLRALLLAAIAIVHGVRISNGTHVLLGQRFVVSLPSLDAAHVLIVLHGFGKDHDGAEAISIMRNFAPAVAASHILVAPDGPLLSRSISLNALNESYAYDTDQQTPTQFNVEFIGKALVDYLTDFDNVVSKDVGIFGFSVGAHLLNDLLIWSDDERVTHAITLNSQLDTNQFHDDQFFTPSQDRDAVNSRYRFPQFQKTGERYQPKASLVKRHLLQIVGGADTVVPAAGGAALLNLHFLDWQESALRYARAYGYSGEKAELTTDNETFASVSYLDGRVVTVMFKDHTHSFESGLGCLRSEESPASGICGASCCAEAESQGSNVSCCKRPTGAQLIADFLGVGSDGHVSSMRCRPWCGTRTPTTSDLEHYGKGGYRSRHTTVLPVLSESHHRHREPTTSDRGHYGVGGYRWEHHQLDRQWQQDALLPEPEQPEPSEHS